MDSLETDLETLENAMRQFFQTMKRPQNWTRVAVRSGVTIDRSSAIILKMLLNAPMPCRVQDLADHLGIEAPFVTRKTQQLERAGYLRRVPDKTDRRAIDLHLTSLGRSTTTKLWKAQRDITAEALRQWKPAERRQFVTLFGRFSDNMATASHQEKTVRV
ncbi:MAG TPA: MarR family transcriptional regulator [Candidatus Saccharimonadales bacterium]|nr:MarR family transcriptional regulator [Candidatus Saccharimonadales bacterium]